MPSTRYEILLPLQYNDGTDIEAEKFELTWTELVDCFGAVTIEPQSLRGFWIYDGERFEDVLVRLTVDVPDSQATRQFFAAYKERLKERFQQLDIWITAQQLRIV